MERAVALFVAKWCEEGDETSGVQGPPRKKTKVSPPTTASASAALGFTKVGLGECPSLFKCDHVRIGMYLPRCARRS